MYDCNGFIEREKENCNLLNRQIKEVDKPNNDFINPNLIIGKWESIDTIKEHILFSYNTLLSEYNLIMPENNTYVFSANQNYFIYLNGTTIAWPPMGCKIFPIENDLIEVEYNSFTGEIFSRIRYKRVSPSNE